MGSLQTALAGLGDLCERTWVFALGFLTSHGPGYRAGGRVQCQEKTDLMLIHVGAVTLSLPHGITKAGYMRLCTPIMRTPTLTAPLLPYSFQVAFLFENTLPTHFHLEMIMRKTGLDDISIN